MLLKPGEIATALFYFSDQTGAKRRPVLVVSSEDYNVTTQNAVVTAISSRSQKDRYDYKIESWKTSGLKMPSKVRTGQLLAVSGALLQKIGTLSEEEYLEVRRLLADIMGLITN